MPRQTLTSYIKRAGDEMLDKIFHFVVAEMNRRKAAKQNVDVGFWDSNGNYTEDIQKLEPEEQTELNELYSPDIDLIVWFDNKKGVVIPEIYIDEFLRKVQDLALSYGMDYSRSSSPRGMFRQLKELEKDGYFETEETRFNNAEELAEILRLGHGLQARVPPRWPSHRPGRLQEVQGDHPGRRGAEPRVSSG